MSQSQSQTHDQLLAELNDLLQLDHDAVRAYTLAIKALDDPLRRNTLMHFRGDHERHIDNLVRVIQHRGGTPVQLSHIPSGAFKLAVQAAGNAGGDREVLLAFKANERQVRDKYLRLAGTDLPRDVAELVAHNAADEVKHYAWASEVLETMGAGEDTLAGRAEAAFEVAHARTADVMESAERAAMEQAERVRRGAKGAARKVRKPAAAVSVLAAAALGALILRTLRD